MTVTCRLIAGNGGNAARWAPVVARSTDAVRFVPLVLPGFDGVALPTASPTLDDYAAWIAEAVPTRTDTVILGHGIGGSLLLHAAQSHDLAAGYIFHAPVGPRLDQRIIPRLMRPMPVRRLARSVLAGPLGSALAVRRFGEAQGRAFAQGYRDCEVFAAMFSLLTSEWYDALQPVTTPSALLWGEGDRVVQSEDTTGFEAVLPTASLRVEPGWAHYPMLTQADAYARTVSELVREMTS